MKAIGSRHLSALALAGALAAVVVSGAAAQTARQAATKRVALYDVGTGFAPVTLRVKKGTKVVWKSDKTNSTGHTVTLESEKSARKARFFDSGTIAPGKSYSRRLTVKGRYHLYCKLHGGMYQDIYVR